ncbi:MAG: MgtC/SapB family protein [Candidatus Melainabacteria bacterium]
METHLIEATLRLALSLILGSIVGFEREYNRQSAGLRTHILVCLGATVFTLVSISDMSSELMAVNATTHMINIARDPARIAAQIVTGIGFIGGGAVLRHGASVRGLTTAASLWMMASVGMLVGIGHYALSIMATVFAFLVLFFIGKFERSVFEKHIKKFSKMRIQLNVATEHQTEAKNWLEKEYGDNIVDIKSTQGDAHHPTQLSYLIDVHNKLVSIHTISHRVNELPGVTGTSIRLFHDEMAASH